MASTIARGFANFRAFVDRDILIYAADESTPGSRKTAIAREVLWQRELVISVQVLNEFTVHARKPEKLNLSAARMAEWCERLLLFHALPLTVDTYLGGLVIHARFQLSHWDSLIVASAQAGECEGRWSIADSR